MGPGALELIAPLIVGVIFILTVGGVILLKPIANNLGHLLEAMAKERSEPQIGSELGHIKDLLETTNARLTLLEERQDFSDALLNDPARRKYQLGAPAKAEESPQKAEEPPQKAEEPPQDVGS